MPISYVYTGEPMTGTTNDDFIIGFKGSTGTDNNTINGNLGDDLVIADSSDTWIPNSSYLNGSIANAFNLETLTSTWTTAENEMFGDWTLPHTTVMAETTIGQSEYFRVEIGAGQQIIIDVDFASNWAIGNGRDLVVELQDSLGNIIATADDSLVTDGGQGSMPSSPGSASSYDPYLAFTVTNAGTYYINVRPFGGGPGSTFTDNNTFLLNVSVTGHAVNATNPIQGADTVNGGDGNDALFSQGGNDIVNGGDGDDFIDTGSGEDIASGGEGNDTLYGGNGTEENIHGDNGNDTLYSGGEGHYYGDAGDDLIYAGLTSGVNEVLDGGTGIDTLDTTSWNGTYNINLTTGATDFGESFINFENVVTGNGSDTITGTSDANVISTRGGVDTVLAGGGDDIVAGGAEGDTLDGEGGSDTLDYRLSSGAIVISLASNTVSGGHGTGDVISNFENVWGTVLGDSITGNSAANALYGFEGADTISGGSGNDFLDGGINNDTLSGGDGVDILEGGAGDDLIDGGTGTDTASFQTASAFVVVTLGIAGAQNTRAGMDTLVSIERLIGSDFNDQLYGNTTNDRLEGGDGNDFMVGGAGDDTFYGGDGDDRMEGGAGNDILNGNTGRDTAIYSSASSGVTINLNVDTQQNTVGAGLDTLNSIERVIGSNFGDTLLGNTSNNVLYGEGGNDTISAGAGSDVIYGGLGNDDLVGGAGQDSFMFDTALSALNNVDDIADYTPNYDRIRLSADIFTAAGSLGTLDASAFHVGSGAADASDRIIYNSATGNIYYDPDGVGGVAQILFAQVTPGTALTNTDFIII